MKKFVSVVIPSMNEEENVPLMYKALLKELSVYPKYEIIFVDDGSSDKTLDVIKKVAAKDVDVKYISFSRNFGHQSALLAGLAMSKGDAVVSIDCDMQHPPHLIPQLIEKWAEGYAVVYTIRDDKNTPWFKKTTSAFFYSIINLLSDIKIDPGAADYRLLDRKIVDRIVEMNESVVFLRGMISWYGFKSTYIKYVPNQRKYGVTKYSLKKMMYFALDGITSMSISPLRLSSFIGFFLSLFSGIYGLYAIALHFTNIQVISGWTSVILSVLFLGGIQLLMLGILGEYVGKTYLESKNRPHYLVQETNIV